MYKYSQSTRSLIDFLVQLVPDWNGGPIFITTKPTNRIDDKAAKTLFAIWKDDKNVVDDKVLAKPVNIGIDDIDRMAQAGLIKSHGETLEVTDKGAEIIKTMILGDDKSAFEDMGDILDFKQALANTKPKLAKNKRKTKVASKQSKESGNWYKRLKNEN